MGKNLPGIRTTHASVPHKTPRTKALDPNGVLAQQGPVWTERIMAYQLTPKY
jgi:hypothetical protein